MEPTRRELGSSWASGLTTVPGTFISCLLVTAITILLAIFNGHPQVDPVLRPLYFALLFTAFHSIRKKEKNLSTLPYRLVELGFLVLTCAFAVSTVLRLAYGDLPTPLATSLIQNLERGAVFLLGLSLISYGIILWIPDLLRSYRILKESYDLSQGQLQAVTKSHHHMEHRIVEADRYHALGELAAGVAHDLRNPLTIVKATAESLARKSLSQEDLSEHSRIITRNLEKADRTIAALMDLGRARSLTTKTEDLNLLVAEVMALVNGEAKRRKVRLIHMHEAPVFVETDAKQLLQALLNLLLNAMQVSSPQSDVIIRVRPFDLQGNAWAAVAVEDRGSGLGSKERQKLFTPFFTTKEEGTGLGLLSCRRILEDLGGNIGLFPRHRQGARALILLPMTTAAVGAA